MQPRKVYLHKNKHDKLGFAMSKLDEVFFLFIYMNNKGNAWFLGTDILYI